MNFESGFGLGPSLAHLMIECRHSDPSVILPVLELGEVLTLVGAVQIVVEAGESCTNWSEWAAVARVGEKALCMNLIDSVVEVGEEVGQQKVKPGLLLEWPLALPDCCDHFHS